MEMMPQYPQRTIGFVRSGTGVPLMNVCSNPHGCQQACRSTSYASSSHVDGLRHCFLPRPVAAVLGGFFLRNLDDVPGGILDRLGVLAGFLAQTKIGSVCTNSPPKSNASLNFLHVCERDTLSILNRSWVLLVVGFAAPNSQSRVKSSVIWPSTFAEENRLGD